MGGAGTELEREGDEGCARGGGLGFAFAIGADVRGEIGPGDFLGRGKT